MSLAIKTIIRKPPPAIHTTSTITPGRGAVIGASIYQENIKGRVAWWLVACVRKPKVLSSIPAITYVQR